MYKLKTHPRAGFLLVCLLPACAALPVPPLAPPALPADYPAQRSQAGDSGAVQKASPLEPSTGADATAAEDPWWQALQDADLDGLIASALAGNHDVRLALARVEQARAALQATGTRSAPQLGVGGDASTSRSGLPAQVKIGNPDVRALQAHLDASLELDLFGSAAAATAAAQADYVGQRWAVEGTRLLVETEVARQYLALRSLERATAVDLVAARLLEQIDALTALRVREGTAARIDLDRADSARDLARSVLPGDAARHAAIVDALCVLTGAAPGSLATRFPLPAPPPGLDAQLEGLLQPVTGILADPGVPPVGQPADLLRRRPDIRQAAQRDAAAQARQRGAHADRYPHFALAALLGDERLTLNGIPFAPAAYSSAALAFSLPVIDGGRLAAAEALQAAQRDEQSLRYAQTVLRAVQEVDTRLAELHAGRERHDHALQARQAAVAGLRRVRILQREGEVDRLNLFDLTRQALSAQYALIDAERARAAAAIELLGALGGGWHSASSPASAAIGLDAVRSPSRETSQ